MQMNHQCRIEFGQQIVGQINQRGVRTFEGVGGNRLDSIVVQSELRAGQFRNVREDLRLDGLEFVVS